MKFSFLIVNYNTERHIIDLLDDLSSQSYQNFEVIIVNNAQNNTMLNLLAGKAFAFVPTLIQSPKNVGFGRAMNLGAESAVGEHFLITNPDVVIEDADFLQKLVIEMDKHPNYGAMTCRLLNEQGEDKSEFVHFEFQHTLGITENIRWLSGAFLFFRKEVYRQLGGFDKDFFMYCEDEDICYRVQKLGLNLVKLNGLSVYHSGGASEPFRDFDFFYRLFRSHFLFAYKHFGNDEFKSILLIWNKKSKQRYFKYNALRFFNINRYLMKKNQWHAMYDVTQKTLTEGVDWLYFGLENDDE